MATEIDDRLLTVGQVQERLGASRSFTRRLIMVGTLPSVNLASRCVRVRASALERFTEERTRIGTER